MPRRCGRSKWTGTGVSSACGQSRQTSTRARPILWRRDAILILLKNIRLRAQVSFCGAGGVYYHVLREACFAPFFVAGFPAVIAAAGKVLGPCSLAVAHLFDCAYFSGPATALIFTGGPNSVPILKLSSL